MDVLSSHASTIILIITIFTGTIFSDKKDVGTTLKKANYYSLVFCGSIFFLLIVANGNYFKDFDPNIIHTLMLFYLIMFILNYILICLINIGFDPSRSICKRIGIVILPVAIIIGLMFYLFNVNPVDKYIPKDTIVKIYDNDNKNYYLLKAKKDLPIKWDVTPVYSSDKIKTKFTVETNKFELKEGTKLIVVKNSVFLRVSNEESKKYKECNKTYIKDFGELNDESRGQIDLLDNDTVFYLPDDLEVTLTDKTVLTIYTNNSLMVFKIFAGVFIVILLLVEIIRSWRALPNSVDEANGSSSNSVA